MSNERVVQSVLTTIVNVRKRIQNIMVLQRQLASFDQVLKVMEFALSEKAAEVLSGLNELESLIGEVGLALDILNSDTTDRRVTKFIACWHSEAVKRRLLRLSTRIVEVFKTLDMSIDPSEEELLEYLISDEQHTQDDRADRNQLNEELPFLLESLEDIIDPEQYAYLRNALADALDAGEFCLSNEGVKYAMSSVAHELQTLGDEEEMANLTGDDLLVDVDNELGRGGFGVVFLGRFLDIPCAVKMIDIGEDVVSDAARINLRNEVKIWREIKHPNIVEFYGAAIVDHRMLMALELCDLSLGEVIHKQHVNFSHDFDTYCAIARGICRAVAHLHANFIIHRDIKPSNIMVSESLHMVKLTDFGMSLAKEEIYRKAITSTIRGTPVYMAPEVCFPPAHWTFRADVYSLAILLWEMFNGEHPFEEESSSMHIMHRVAMTNERPPLNEDMPHWLWKVMENAWDPIPERRPTADMILLKIDKHSKDTSRTSMRVIGNMLSRIRRRPGKPSATMMARKASTVESANRVCTQNEFRPIMGSILRKGSRSQPEPPLAPPPGLGPRPSFHSIDSLGQNPSFSSLGSSMEGYFPNTQHAHYPDSSHDGDGEDDEELEKEDNEGFPLRQDLALLRFRSYDDSSSISLGSGSVGQAYGKQTDGRANLLAVGGMFGLELWDARTGRKVKTLPGHTGAVFALSFSVNSSILVSAAGDRTIRIWDTEKYRCTSTLRGHKDAVNCVAISQNANIIASGSSDKTIMIWNRKSSEVVFSFTGHGDAVTEVCFTPDESKLVSASQDCTIRVWSLQDTGLLFIIPTGKPIKSLALSADGNQAAVAHPDKVLGVFSLTTFELITELRAHSTPVNFVAWSSDPGELFASASRGGSIRLWSASEFEQVRQLSGHSSRCDFVRFSAKGGFLISCSRDHTTRIWNVNSGRNIKTLQHETMPLCASFSPFFLR